MFTTYRNYKMLSRSIKIWSSFSSPPEATQVTQVAQETLTHSPSESPGCLSTCIHSSPYSLDCGTVSLCPCPANPCTSLPLTLMFSHFIPLQAIVMSCCVIPPHPPIPIPITFRSLLTCQPLSLRFSINLEHFNL